MPLLIKNKVKFVKKTKTGVVRIVRDTYSNSKGNWWDHKAKIKTWDGRCLDCRKSADETPEGHLHVHHIKPLSRGGTTRKINLITLCERCHHKRHKHMHKDHK